MLKRADVMLIEAGLADSMALARALIMEGRVVCGARKILKPSEPIKAGETLKLTGDTRQYVSRGAEKLKKALDVFDIDIKGACCVDIGASTGGFTDIMLRAGAKRVYAVDVGYNLLDWRLRSDTRVVCMERVNARFITPDMFDDIPDFGATDVSFISLKAILPSVYNILKPDARFVALMKPQFEAAREDVGERGVVRDPNVHLKVITSIVEFAQNTGWRVNALDYSPIRGPMGNIEFLLDITRAAHNSALFDYASIPVIIRDAYDKLVK